MVKNPSKDNLRANVQFLIAEGLSRWRFVRESKLYMYSNYSYSNTAVVESCNKFREGRNSINDLPRPSTCWKVSELQKEM